MADRRALVEQAQREHRVLRIVYQGADRNGSKERHIEVYEFDGTYIDAFCRRAKDKRTFRLDRVISLELLEDRFVPDLHVMDAIDREGWANRSSRWRRQKAAELDTATPYVPSQGVQPASQPIPSLPTSAYRSPNDSSGLLAKVAAAIIIGVVGVSALLSSGSSSSSRGTYSSSSYSSSPAPAYSNHLSVDRSLSLESTQAKTGRTEYYPRTSSSTTLKNDDFRVDTDRVKPFIAENGSYYGELNVNRVPKTVHVNGYFRKDGTYVQGHYRSAPYSNPPSFKSSTPKSSSSFHTSKMPSIRSSSGSRGRGR